MRPLAAITVAASLALLSGQPSSAQAPDAPVQPRATEAEAADAEAPEAARTRLESMRPPLSAGLFFEPDRKTLCELVETAARDNALPIGFFARLIRAESSFNPMAVSPKGAQGIAQFMRGTADMRGLVDPFDPVAAIRASAEYLDELRDRYGNLGLAAAAYNAGEARVSSWMGGASGLPLETRGYVWKITGRAAEEWLPTREDEGTGEEQTATEETAGDKEKAETEECMEIATAAGALRPEPRDTAPATAPWGVQLAGNYSLDVAMRSYRRLQDRHPKLLGGVEPMVVTRRVGGRGPRTFYRLQAPAQTKQEAQRLCGSLRSSGGACLVLPNR